MTPFESPEIPRTHRSRLLDEVGALIQDRQSAAAQHRKDFFQPDISAPEKYVQSLLPYRQKLSELLGWPMGQNAEDGEPVYALVREDDAGRVYRVSSAGIGPVRGYGLIFLPTSSGSYPLVIANHGGQGSPELASGLGEGGTANYNRMITGLREHPVAIYAPQLLVWQDAQEPKMNQYHLDRKLRHCGGSRAALDLFLLQRALDALCRHPEVNGNRVGVCGLSYGGFYALFLAALDERIKVAVSSCFLNDRHRYDWEDFVWTDAARYFLDAEVAQMICPRPLFLEVGREDAVFLPEGVPEIAMTVAQNYRALRREDQFVFRTHNSGHEYDPDGQAEAFLLKHLQD